MKLQLEFSFRSPRLCALLAALLWLFVTPTRAQITVPEWVQRYNGTANNADSARAIAVDNGGNVIVVGDSVGVGSGYDMVTIKYSGAGIPLWTNRYNGPGNGDESARAVALDDGGNVLVTGASYNDTGNSDFATLKYSSAGQPLWTNRYDGPGSGHDYANSVAVDPNGDLIVTGSSRGAGGNDDYATIKYSSAGLPLWTNRYNGPGDGADTAVAVVVDAVGEVIVTGSSYGASSGTDWATIKYSSAGMPLWTNRYHRSGNGDDAAHALAVDISGNAYVTGSSWNGTSHDFATIKYSGAGQPLWTNYYNSPADGEDEAVGVGVDVSGNVFVTGPSGGGASLTDYATLKYSSAGVPLWTNRYNGPANGFDRPNAVACDRQGNCYVTGYSAVNSVSFDIATIGYSGDGTPLWTNRYNGLGNDQDAANAVAVDAGGNVYVTGYSTGNGSFSDFTTVKYSLLRPIPLVCQRLEGQWVLSWTNAAFHLQCAPAVTGIFSNLPGATSPWTGPITGAPQFFRLSAN